MIALTSVSKPRAPRTPFESAAPTDVEGLAATARRQTPGKSGHASNELSRSVKHLVVKGKSDNIEGSVRSRSPFETVIGVDERARILDTDLSPWRMICALRMRGTNGAGAIGTGWLVGPKTLITAGHCVHSTDFFGGWASQIEVAPGRNGNEFPFTRVTSQRFTSVDRWVQQADPDFDIGCIHLDQSIGDDVGWFSVGALPPDELESYLVNVSGYPGDRGAGTEQYHHRNRVLRVSERRLFYDVDTFGGQSGAPVWIQESDATAPIAVGIHAYGTGGTPSNFGLTANSAPRIIPEVLDQIAAWVQEDGGWPET